MNIAGTKEEHDDIDIFIVLKTLGDKVDVMHRVKNY